MEPAKAKPPIVVILGSTGTGKTKLSLELATRYGGEIVSADSMQNPLRAPPDRTLMADAETRYNCSSAGALCALSRDGLDIVTAKATKAEQAIAKHHLLDVVTPDRAFTVTHFREQALPIVAMIGCDDDGGDDDNNDEQRGDGEIDSLLSAGRMPIVVGGTNYYIESLLWQVLIGDGVRREHIRRRSAAADEGPTKRPKSGDAGDDQRPKPPEEEEQQVSGALVDRCRAGTLSVDELESYEAPALHKLLATVDRPSANRLHPNNKRKIIRYADIEQVREEEKEEKKKEGKDLGSVSLVFSVTGEADPQLNESSSPIWDHRTAVLPSNAIVIL
ncbi:hypothetical protein AND_008659 [Anopheles darlingi]|uniref:Uncharacterized protein n=1 Tax=Anopheles darlingi TaxID=43151 RepID=W5JAD2_ANODA|nr:hypothetical protein AND_008659 [Anopheles darlingi]